MALGTDDKKKLYLLGGLAGLLGVAGLVILNPFKSSTPSDVATPVAGQSASKAGGSSSGGYPGGAASYPGASYPGASGSSAPDSGASSGTTEAVGGLAGTSGTASTAPRSRLVAAQKFRDDPFVPYFTKAAIPPPPPPTPAPPAPIPPPIPLPSPGNSDGPSYPGLPGAGTASSNEQFPVLVGLPSPRISRYVTVQTAPTVQSAPPNVSGGGSTLTRSPNKRLAGVIIGDSVRALLEIDDGTGGEPKTQIVQPGDEVEGVRVLRIERYTEVGGRARVRMVVREGGEERSIELRASSQQAGGQSGGYPSGGGYPGGSGGYPGGSGGYPGGGRRNF